MVPHGDQAALQNTMAIAIGTSVRADARGLSIHSLEFGEMFLVGNLFAISCRVNMNTTALCLLQVPNAC